MLIGWIIGGILAYTTLPRPHRPFFFFLNFLAHLTLLSWLVPTLFLGLPMHLTKAFELSYQYYPK